MIPTKRISNFDMSWKAWFEKNPISPSIWSIHETIGVKVLAFGRGLDALDCNTQSWGVFQYSFIDCHNWTESWTRLYIKIGWARCFPSIQKWWLDNFFTCRGLRNLSLFARTFEHFEFVCILYAMETLQYLGQIPILWIKSKSFLVSDLFDWIAEAMLCGRSRWFNLIIPL